MILQKFFIYDVKQSLKMVKKQKMAKKDEAEGLPESQTKYCGGCGKKVHINAKTCPHCGYNLESSAKFSNKTLAIIGLILNIFIWPGLGTLISGNVGTGVAQMILFLVSIPLMFVIIGIPLAIGIWIWALVSSISQIKRVED